MGTGGPSAIKTLTIYENDIKTVFVLKTIKTVFDLMHLQGFEPGTH